ncbi:hypothetical protein ID866_9684 [Astraeus odoratus]|nr:hypothetical protein ID866_9684 [Astraeus odoratus]
MTTVQSLVTALLPDLARPHDPSASPSQDAPRDLLVRARTGTGKTLAFLIPAVEKRLSSAKQHVEDVCRSSGLSSPRLLDRASNAFRRTSPGPLILSPTRELAIQIADVALKLTTHHQNFQVNLLVGGTSKGPQLRQWKKGYRDLVVATPGRLRDLLENEPELVLDEADTLLDMGFRDDIDAIAKFLAPPQTRQTFLLSATLSRRIRQIATSHLSPNHQFLDASPPTSDSPLPTSSSVNPRVPWALESDTELTTHAHIPQYYTPLPSVEAQMPALLRLIAHDQLAHGPQSKIVLFCPTTHSTAFYSTLLRELAADGTLPAKNTRIVEMHSRLSQAARERASREFRAAGSKEASKKSFTKGRLRQTMDGPAILVTSDVSARGVDYPNVSRVIQLGVPSADSLYVHRVGRTGRGASTLNPVSQSGSSSVPTIAEGEKDATNTTTEPRHRADLLLLPWEMRSVKWQLAQFPLRELPVATLESQVNELVTAPSCRYRDSGAIFNTNTTATASVDSDSNQHSTDPLSTRFRSLLPLLDAEAIRQTASSLMGHYLPLAGPLRVKAGTILTGVAAWSRMFGVEMGTPNAAWLRRMGVQLEDKDGSKRTRIGDLITTSKSGKRTYKPSATNFGGKFSGRNGKRRAV